MTTVAPFAAPTTTGAAEADRVARLGLVDDLGANLADLNDAPQTIGGGPRCSVRLGATGLRPLHCVITPSQDGPVVRRWAAETRLNGRDFTEAALTAGDLLRIGSIDLRVVALPCEASREQPVHASVEPLPTEASLPEAAAVAEPNKSDTTPVEPISPPSVSPAPIVEEDAVEREWLDESVSEPPAAPPAAELDPAIPSRLLRPWAASEPATLKPLATPSEPAAETGVPTSDDPFAAMSGLEAAMEMAFEPELQQPAFAEEEPAVALSEIGSDIDNDDPWRVVTPAIEKPADSIACFDATAAAAFGVESQIHPAQEASPTPLVDNAAIERLRARTTASRDRVKRLVAVIRGERRQTAELADAVSDLASQLEQALVASDEASAELARLANEHAATSHELAAAREALAEALGRAERLETQVADLEASLAAGWTSPTVEDSAADYVPEPLAPLESATAFEDPSADWREEADAVPVFADEVLDDNFEATEWPTEDAETAQDEPNIWQTPAETEPEAEAADEPLWGIERLAVSEEPASTDSPWAGLAAEQSAPEPEASYEELSSYVEEAEVEAPIVEEPAPADADDELSEPSLQTDSEETAAEVPGESPVTIADLWRSEESENSVEESVAPPKPEPEPQVSFIERFAHLVPEEDEPVQQPAVVPSLPTAPASDNDESIDDYMRKLMQRVRGSSTNEDTPAPAKKQPTIAAAVSEIAVERREAPAQPEPAEPAAPNQELIRDLTELRRGPAPEQMANMGALRQLANQSARHAIDVAASRQSREKATMRLAVSVISVAVGTFASIVAPSPLDLQFIGGFSSVLIGGWFFVRTVKQCQVRTLDQQIAHAAKHAG